MTRISLQLCKQALFNIRASIMASVGNENNHVGEGEAQTIGKGDVSPKCGVKRPLSDKEADEAYTKRIILNPVPDAEVVQRRKKRKFALLLSYSGKGYLGMQRNPGFRTIEDDLLNAMLQADVITEEGCTCPQLFHFQRAARTDKGVSAARQVVSLKLPEDVPDLAAAINKHLTPQIRVMSVKRVTKNFNCKSWCDSRTYSYMCPSFAFAPVDQVSGKSGKSNKEGDLLVHHEASSFRGGKGLQDEKYKPHLILYVLLSFLDSSSKNLAALCKHVQVQLREDQNVEKHDDYQCIIEVKTEVHRVTNADYRISPEVLAEVRSVLKLYLGTHNFHNFTARKKSEDASAQRYIINIECGEPFLREGMEWLIIKIKGQSFMLHQIRKMIGLCISISRGLAGQDVITKAWNKNKVDIPIAPGLGLVLEEPHYDKYNQRYGSDGFHQALNWDNVEKNIQEFREEFIDAVIVQTEKEEKPMLQWLATLPMHTFDVRTQDTPNNQSQVRSGIGKAEVRLRMQDNSEDEVEDEDEGDLDQYRTRVPEAAAINKEEQ